MTNEQDDEWYISELYLTVGALSERSTSIMASRTSTRAWTMALFSLSVLGLLPAYEGLTSFPISSSAVKSCEYFEGLCASLT